MKRSGIADLPLRGGHMPTWLAKRITKLGTAITEAVVRDYFNAPLGFQKLEKHTDIPAKSLMRMLGPKGSPSAANLSNILTALQKSKGVLFELAARPQAMTKRSNYEREMKSASFRRVFKVEYSEITKSSGNVFSDLSRPNSELELLKAKLTLQIYNIIKKRGVTQTKAAEVLSIKQPKVKLRAQPLAAGPLEAYLAGYRVIRKSFGNNRPVRLLYSSN